MTIRTHFDGHMIHLPQELQGHAPCDVEIILADEARHGARRASIWEVVSQSRGTRDSASILREASADRDTWSRS